MTTVDCSAVGAHSFYIRVRFSHNCYTFRRNEEYYALSFFLAMLKMHRTLFSPLRRSGARFAAVVFRRRREQSVSPIVAPPQLTSRQLIF